MGEAGPGHSGFPGHGDLHSTRSHWMVVGREAAGSRPSSFSGGYCSSSCPEEGTQARGPVTGRRCTQN